MATAHDVYKTLLDQNQTAKKLTGQRKFYQAEQVLMKAKELCAHYDEHVRHVFKADLASFTLLNIAHLYILQHEYHRAVQFLAECASNSRLCEIYCLLALLLIKVLRFDKALDCVAAANSALKTKPKLDATIPYISKPITDILKVLCHNLQGLSTGCLTVLISSQLSKELKTVTSRRRVAPSDVAYVEELEEAIPQLQEQAIQLNMTGTLLNSTQNTAADRPSSHSAIPALPPLPGSYRSEGSRGDPRTTKTERNYDTHDKDGNHEHTTVTLWNTAVDTHRSIASQVPPMFTPRKEFDREYHVEYRTKWDTLEHGRTVTDKRGQGPPAAPPSTRSKQPSKLPAPRPPMYSALDGPIGGEEDDNASPFPFTKTPRGQYHRPVPPYGPKSKPSDKPLGPDADLITVEAVGRHKHIQEKLLRQFGEVYLIVCQEEESAWRRELSNAEKAHRLALCKHILLLMEHGGSVPSTPSWSLPPEDYEYQQSLVPTVYRGVNKAPPYALNPETDARYPSYGPNPPPMDQPKGKENSKPTPLLSNTSKPKRRVVKPAPPQPASSPVALKTPTPQPQDDWPDQAKYPEGVRTVDAAVSPAPFPANRGLGGPLDDPFIQSVQVDPNTEVIHVWTTQPPPQGIASQLQLPPQYQVAAPPGMMYGGSNLIGAPLPQPQFVPAPFYQGSDQLAELELRLGKINAELQQVYYEYDTTVDHKPKAYAKALIARAKKLEWERDWVMLTIVELQQQPPPAAELQAGMAPYLVNYGAQQPATTIIYEQIVDPPPPQYPQYPQQFPQQYPQQFPQQYPQQFPQQYPQQYPQQEDGGAGGQPFTHPSLVKHHPQPPHSHRPHKKHRHGHSHSRGKHNHPTSPHSKDGEIAKSFGTLIDQQHKTNELLHNLLLKEDTTRQVITTYSPDEVYPPQRERAVYSPIQWRRFDDSIADNIPPTPPPSPAVSDDEGSRKRRKGKTYTADDDSSVDSLSQVSYYSDDQLPISYAPPVKQYLPKSPPKPFGRPPVGGGPPPGQAPPRPGEYAHQPWAVPPTGPPAAGPPMTMAPMQPYYMQPPGMEANPMTFPFMTPLTYAMMSNMAMQMAMMPMMPPQFGEGNEVPPGWVPPWQGMSTMAGAPVELQQGEDERTQGYDNQYQPTITGPPEYRELALANIEDLEEMTRRELLGTYHDMAAVLMYYKELNMQRFEVSAYITQQCGIPAISLQCPCLPNEDALADALATIIDLPNPKKRVANLMQVLSEEGGKLLALRQQAPKVKPGIAQPRLAKVLQIQSQSHHDIEEMASNLMEAAFVDINNIMEDWKQTVAQLNREAPTGTCKDSEGAVQEWGDYVRVKTQSINDIMSVGADYLLNYVRFTECHYIQLWTEAATNWVFFGNANGSAPSKRHKHRSQTQLTVMPTLNMEGISLQYLENISRLIQQRREVLERSVVSVAMHAHQQYYNESSTSTLDSVEDIMMQIRQREIGFRQVSLQYEQLFESQIRSMFVDYCMGLRDIAHDYLHKMKQENNSEPFDDVFFTMVKRYQQSAIVALTRFISDMRISHSNVDDYYYALLPREMLSQQAIKQAHENSHAQDQELD